jgi:hypothetical protein
MMQAVWWVGLYVVVVLQIAAAASGLQPVPAHDGAAYSVMHGGWWAAAGV